jgi:hypothetical protein
MRDVVIIKNSDGPYNGGRWGDYSGVSCDPSDDRTFWMNHEYTPGGDIWNTWISRCTAPNAPPDAPDITGPSIGTDGVEYEFNFVSTDPEGNDVYYMVDWGDESKDDWIGPFPSGQEITVNHTWTEIGEYEIKAKAKDEFDEESDWTEPKIMEIVENEPPNAPEISGTNQGKPGKLYNFYFTSTDPEGNDVSYLIEWGDGTITDWSAYQGSGVILKDEHRWEEKGTFTIRTKAKDSFGEEGDWGELEISMPRGKISFSSMVYKLLQRFPNLIPILKILLT